MDVRALHILGKGLRWQDAVDVFLLTIVFSRLYAWTKRTVAVQIAFGLLVLLAASWTASHLGLILTSYLLSATGAVAAVIIVVVFQQEIRKGLSRVSPLRWLTGQSSLRGDHDARAMLVKAAFAIARRRKGALIVIRRRDPVDEHVTVGVVLDARVSSSLLESLFTSTSPLHDGAAVVEGDRLTHAAVVLPLATETMPSEAGTRHRAALGLSARCDALVVCVSEERGAVTLAEGGDLREVADEAALDEALARLGVGSGAARGTPVAGHPARLRDLWSHAVIFAGVLVAWAAIALDRSHAVGRILPLEIRGLSDGLVFDAPRFTSVAVEVRSSRRELEVLPPDAVEAYVDLTGAGPGSRTYHIQTDAPAGIEVVSAVPTSISLQLRPRGSAPAAVGEGLSSRGRVE